MILRFTVTFILLIARIVPGQTPATQPGTALPRAETAIDLGLLHLERQQHAEGHFESDRKLAITGLALTCFLAAGHGPDVGRHGGTVRRAIDYVVRQAPSDGYFGKIDGSRMYGQAIVMVALCQAYGLEHDPSRRATMRPALVAALKVIIDAQNVTKDASHAGGWRYEPSSPDSDLSVSAWNIVALRAARDVGLDVSEAAIANAVAYVKRCAHATKGGFSYQPGRDPSIGMTAAGMLALSLVAGEESLEFAAGAKVLNEKPIGDATRFPYYVTYYANQSAHRVGGEMWSIVSRTTQERLLRTQLPSGAWPQSTSREEPGESYATAMAVLTLSVPQRVLPMYRR